ncbi:MAG TPA: hypothetical protein VI814_13335 [Candidatus Limnocylindria bacterium]
MNDERDLQRYASRRAALHSALRGGDALVAARAASRLRLDGFLLTADEFARARDARRALGLAIVKARMTKAGDEPLRHDAAITETPRSNRRLIAAAALVAALLIALLLFGNGRGLGPAGGGTPAANDAPQQQPQAQLLTVSRGRTITLPADIVAVEAPPTPAATAIPTGAPTEAPAGSGQPGPTSGPGGTGAGGSGGGSGGGDGSGTGSGSGTGLGTPTPTATPAIVPPGYSRLNVVVYDASTGRPLPDVCIIIGTLNCGPTQPHTDRNGRWSADVAATNNSTLWDLYFIKSGYVTQFRQITLPGGVSRTYAIYLRRSR